MSGEAYDGQNREVKGVSQSKSYLTCIGEATYLNVGVPHMRARSDRVGEGVGGIPPQTVWKIFHFQEP